MRLGKRNAPLELGHRHLGSAARREAGTVCGSNKMKRQMYRYVCVAYVSIITVLDSTNRVIYGYLFIYCSLLKLVMASQSSLLK